MASLNCDFRTGIMNGVHLDEDKQTLMVFLKVLVNDILIFCHPVSKIVNARCWKNALRYFVIPHGFAILASLFLTNLWEEEIKKAKKASVQWAHSA